MSVRAGYSLLEATTAVLAGAVACAALAALLHAGDRLAEARGRRLARLETIRIADAVLRRELGVVDPTADLAGAGQDSVALRLFRAFAVVRGAATTGGVLVAYAGDREPDPERDSLLPLAPPGGVAWPLRAATPVREPCPGASPGDGVAAVPGSVSGCYAFETASAPAPGTVLLLFQHGTYALSGAALRVRHGAEGRQPLTGEWLDDRRTSLVVRATGEPRSARVDVVLGFGATGGAAARLRLPLPNTLERTGP